MKKLLKEFGLYAVVSVAIILTLAALISLFDKFKEWVHSLLR